MYELCGDFCYNECTVRFLALPYEQEVSPITWHDGPDAEMINYFQTPVKLFVSWVWMEDSAVDFSYLMQSSDDFPALLIDCLRAPVGVQLFQLCGNAIVLSHPERVKSNQRQNLVHPAISSEKALQAFFRACTWLLEAGRRGVIDKRQVSTTCSISVITVNCEQAVRA